MREIENLKPGSKLFDKDPEVLRVFDEATDILSGGGVYEKKFNPEQATGLMRGFVDETVRKQRVDASLKTMSFLIEENKGTLSGTIRVESYPNDIIDMTCILSIGENPGLLKLSKLKITSDSRLARWALSALRIEKTTKNDLQDPNVKNPNINEAFKKYLNSRFTKKGVEATELDLRFRKERFLAVKIIGKSIA